jgi:hypothetical protein
MANVKFHQLRTLLKKAKRTGKLMGLEVSKQDYDKIGGLPQYLFWKDASIVNGLLMKGIDSDKLNMFFSEEDYFCGYPCKLNGQTTRAILSDGKEVKPDLLTDLFGWLDAVFNPKIIW